MSKTKLFILSVITGTPLGWIWGWWHYTSGAWIFPPDAVTGIDFFQMPIEDWFFYPITGAFFVTLCILDPIKKILPLKGIAHHRVISEYIYTGMYVFLCVMCAIVAPLLLGKSALMTALFFGFPAMCIMPFLSIRNPAKIIRLAIITIPMEIIWDHWAVGRHGQWEYLDQSGLFAHYINEIPIDMTPYMPIIAVFFIYSIVTGYQELLSRRVEL